MEKELNFKIVRTDTNIFYLMMNNRTVGFIFNLWLKFKYAKIDTPQNNKQRKQYSCIFYSIKRIANLEMEFPIL